MTNFVSLIGRLTKEGEVIDVNGTNCYRNSIAVQREFKNAEGSFDADFIDFTAWNKTADFLNNYGRKGDLIALCGSLRLNKFQDKDGNNQSRLQVIIDKVTLLPNNKKPEGTKQPKLPQTNNDEFEVDDSQLPF